MMGALTALGGPGEVAVRSVAAGHDLLLICDNPVAQQKALISICNSYINNVLQESMLEKSIMRIRHVLTTFLP